jgi:hypothetical protein
MQTTPPPPAYSSASAPPGSRSCLESLPSHLLLRILGHLSLADLVFGLRPTSRTLFLHAISLAREQAYSLWLDQVHRAAKKGAPPSTDPLGRAGEEGGHAEDVRSAPPTYDREAETSTGGSVFASRSHELAVFDHFLVALARSSYKLSASTLLFTNEDDALRMPNDVRQDLFGLMQPRARVEDLLIQLGRGRGWIAQGDGEAQSGKAGPAERIVADDLRVDLKLRDVRMLLPCRSGARNVAWMPLFGVNRKKGDTLETLARCLALGMNSVRLTRRGDASGLRWYEWQ